MDVTVCPPMPAQNAYFEEYRVQGRAQTQPVRPVHLPDKDENGVYERGASFDEIARMNIQDHKAHSHWRTGCPDFMLDKHKIREIIVRFVERRAFSKLRQKKIKGTLQERLISAQKKLDSMRPSLIVTLDHFCEKYLTAKCADDLPAAKKLESVIEGLDSRLRVETPNFAAFVGAVLYFSYRVGNMDSVAVATQLGVKPAHIRQILSRCRKLAGEKPASRGNHSRLREEKEARLAERLRKKKERARARAARITRNETWRKNLSASAKRAWAERKERV